MEIGQIVLSKQGRDSGEYFIVSQILSSEYVLLIDGKIRKIAKPKKKKIKHLVVTDFCNQILKDKFSNGKTVFDSEVFSAIRKYKESVNGGNLSV